MNLYQKSRNIHFFFKVAPQNETAYYSSPYVEGCVVPMEKNFMDNGG
jgi:hypothetical protein